MSNKLMRTLTPKVELKKVEKNIEDTEALVNALHEEKTAVPVKAKVKQVAKTEKQVEPTPVPVIQEAIAPIATNTKEPLRRLTVDVPADMFLAMRLKSVNKFITLREYILELVRKDLAS